MCIRDSSGGDTCENTHTLTVDFGQTVTFDNLEYVARPGAGNGTWTSVTIIGIDEEGTEQTLMEEQEVTLTNNMAVFAFASPQTFRAVRFELTGTGGYGSAAEINATCNVEPVSYTHLVLHLFQQRGRAAGAHRRKRIDVPLL